MHTTAQGTIALVGSGEFLPGMVEVDRLLLARAGGTAARVVVLPTAAAPDGATVFARWGRMGVEYFTGLGAPVEAVPVRTRADAEDPGLAGQIAAASFVYLSGGKPGYLAATLRGTACARALTGVLSAGGVVAGCSAGAMVLAGRMVGGARLWRAVPALGLVPELLVVPHFDELPGWLTPIIRRMAGRGPIAGIPAATALVGDGGGWQVQGLGSITLFAGGQATRYAPGAAVPLPPL